MPAPSWTRNWPITGTSTVDSIEAFDGEIWSKGSNLKMSMEEAVDICKKRGVVPVGSGSFTAHGTGLDPVDGSGSPWQAYVFGTQVAEVEVDTVTGEVQVLGIWALARCGPRHQSARRGRPD